MMMFPKEPKKKKKINPRTKSVIQENNSICYLCNENNKADPLEEHHIFGGTINRKKSEQYGLKVKLCGCKCHRLGAGAVHVNKIVKRILQEEGQRKFEETHTREEFIKEFGKNRL